WMVGRARGLRSVVHRDWNRRLRAVAGGRVSSRTRAVPGDRASAALRVVGGAALVGVAATVWLGLFVTPPDQFMGNLVRLLYVHPPMAWVAFLAYGVAGVASLLYLWP